MRGKVRMVIVGRMNKTPSTSERYINKYRGREKKLALMYETMHVSHPRARVTTLVNERKRLFTLNYVQYDDSK